MSSQNPLPEVFRFDSHEVRVIQDADGEPWFVAKDVCEVLDIQNSRDAIGKLDEDEKGVALTYTPGGRQEMGTVRESGLYTLILRSREATTPGTVAHRFRRWVTSEVLPSIRKRGSYTVPGAQVPARVQDLVSAIVVMCEATAKFPGVRPGIMAASMLNCIHVNTGIDIEPVRLALPPANEPICSLNATRVGELLGVSAVMANKMLSVQGLQVRNERNEWELTEAGKAWAEALPFVNNGHSGYQILWNPEVVKELSKAA
jgi:prophage antirepressor-like protein